MYVRERVYNKFKEFVIPVSKNLMMMSKLLDALVVE